MTHVLAIESTSYEAVLANAEDGILAGCVCGRCGGDDLKLTNSWVDRGFQTGKGEQGYERIFVRLGVCRRCGSRERILPFDALPGNTNSVANIFEAICEESDGVPIAEVARNHGVSETCVRKWRRGLATRFLDLCPMKRHRAMIASQSTETQARLVSFWAFIQEAHKLEGRASIPSPPVMCIERDEETVALKELISHCTSLGGVLETARLGAELFHQPVLLFRSGGASTPSFVGNTSNFDHGASGETPESHDGQQGSGPESDSPVAVPTNRASPTRGPPVGGPRKAVEADQ